MQRTRFEEMACSVARAWAVVGEPWTPLVVRSVFLGVTRFEDLRADLGVARNILTDRLERLVASGVLERRPYGAGGRREYALGEAGRALVPVILAIMAWGDRWTASRGAPPLRLRHDTCGRLAEATVACSACGESLRAGEVTPLPGPGGRRGPGTALVAGRVAARPVRAVGRVSRNIRRPSRSSSTRRSAGR